MPPVWICFRKMLNCTLKLQLSINFKILLNSKMASLSWLKSTNGSSLSLELNLKSLLWFTKFYKSWHLPASLASYCPPLSLSLIPFVKVTLACFLLLEQANLFPVSVYLHMVLLDLSAYITYLLVVELCTHSHHLSYWDVLISCIYQCVTLYHTSVCISYIVCLSF